MEPLPYIAAHPALGQLRVSASAARAIDRVAFRYTDRPTRPTQPRRTA